MDDRFIRQIVLKEVGKGGQKKLSCSRVLVVGVGGLGSSVLYCLAAAGVGHIDIVDYDKVELTNLNRQFIHFEGDLGKEKAVSAGEKLAAFNGGIKVTPHILRLDEKNAQDIVKSADIVLSCVDNIETRLILNKYCVDLNIPLIDGGISGFEGYVFSVLPRLSPCLACQPTLLKNPSKEHGVIGAAASIIGSNMALTAIKTLLGIKSAGFIRYFDLLSDRVVPVRAERNPDCLVCGGAEKK